MDKSKLNNKLRENSTSCFVTIGWKNSNVPITNKVLCQALYGETDVQIAKTLRKQVAENPTGYGFVSGTKFKPSDLFYAIYEYATDEFPHTYSKNIPAGFLSVSQL